MNGWRPLFRKDFRLTRFLFLFSVVMMLLLQLGCLLLSFAAETGVATGVAAYVTYFSVVLLPVFMFQSLHGEWKSSTIYFWIQSPRAGLQVLTIKWAAALLQMVIVMVLASCAMLTIYLFEANSAAGSAELSESLRSFLLRTYCLDGVLLLYAALLGHGFILVYVISKSIRWGWFPAAIGCMALFGLSLVPLSGAWPNWGAFELPLGIHATGDNLSVEYGTYSIIGVLLLLVLSAAVLFVNSRLLKRSTQVHL